jgi:hypothetical protein
MSDDDNQTCRVRIVEAPDGTEIPVPETGRRLFRKIFRNPMISFAGLSCLSK